MRKAMKNIKITLIEILSSHLSSFLFPFDYEKL